ncbi:unnamed protein product [Polarella glacialis]|uniref:NADAR domain-containing protein n=1 Tax=Polarella glacialis TaxID=89957 RepID=A0A813KZ41_POLGL|nr:unnamed protein product [Polarella glacialis]
MGGPCRLKAEAEKLATKAPDCTDNFQVRPFNFDGQEWQSVEQRYQAQKFLDATFKEKLRLMEKGSGESDSQHGMRVWSEGQRGRDLRPDWEAVKVEMMYRANLAKYLQHGDLQADLLATGDAQLDGAASTKWVMKSGQTVGWSPWNGLIQTRIREELKPVSAQDSDLLESLRKQFEDYLVCQGGNQLPIPGVGS